MKLFYSILFYSILFYSILFYSILFYSILFYFILFYCIQHYFDLSDSYLFDWWHFEDLGMEDIWGNIWPIKNCLSKVCIWQTRFGTYSANFKGIKNWRVCQNPPKFWKSILMPSSHLACDGSTEPVSCPYPPFRAASARPPCGGRRRLWDFRTDSRAPRPLRFGLGRSFTNVKKKIVSP